MVNRTPEDYTPFLNMSSPAAIDAMLNNAAALARQLHKKYPEREWPSAMLTCLIAATFVYGSQEPETPMDPFLIGLSGETISTIAKKVAQMSAHWERNRQIEERKAAKAATKQ